MLLQSYSITGKAIYEILITYIHMYVAMYIYISYNMGMNDFPIYTMTGGYTNKIISTHVISNVFHFKRITTFILFTLKFIVGFGLI